jgi:hypothetical protein
VNVPKTTVDLAPTAPHRTVDWMAGRREGFHESIEAIIRSFLAEAARSGLNAPAAVSVARRIRAGAIKEAGMTAA